MKVLNIFLLILLIVAGCETPVKKKEKTYCQLESSLTNSTNASEALIRCADDYAFKASCDFSADPLEVEKGFIEPKTLVWVKNGGNEGVEFKSSNSSGFVTCKKL